MPPITSGFQRTISDNQDVKTAASIDFKEFGGICRMVLEGLMVPKAGLEPARISTVDFESTASTDFATSALKGMRKRCGLYLSHAAMQAATCSSAAKCPKNQRNPTAVTDPTPHNVSARRRSALAGPARCSTDPAPDRSSASLCPSLFAASAADRYRRRTSRSASG